MEQVWRENPATAPFDMTSAEGRLPTTSGSSTTPRCWAPTPGPWPAAETLAKRAGGSARAAAPTPGARPAGPAPPRRSSTGCANLSPASRAPCSPSSPPAATCASASARTPTVCWPGALAPKPRPGGSTPDCCLSPCSSRWSMTPRRSSRAAKMAERSAAPHRPAAAAQRRLRRGPAGPLARRPDRPATRSLPATGARPSRAVREAVPGDLGPAAGPAAGSTP